MCNSLGKQSRNSVTLLGPAYSEVAPANQEVEGWLARFDAQVQLCERGILEELIFGLLRSQT